MPRRSGSTPLQRTEPVHCGQTFTLTQQPPVGTNTEAFVRQLYLDILSRTADIAGLNTWAGWINSGQPARRLLRSFQSAETVTAAATSPSSTWPSCCAIPTTELDELVSYLHAGIRKRKS